MIEVKHRIWCEVHSPSRIPDLAEVSRASMRVWREADLYGYHGDPPRLVLDQDRQVVTVSLEWGVL